MYNNSNKKRKAKILKNIFRHKGEYYKKKKYYLTNDFNNFLDKIESSLFTKWFLST